MKLRFLGKEAEIRTEAAVIGISVLILLGILIGYIFFRDTGDIIIASGEDRSAERITALTETDAVTLDSPVTGTKSGNAVPTAARLDAGSQDNSGGEKISGETIKVYVVGCVRKPGIVTLDKGSMIYDAVREAGGLTEEADSDNINMVFSLNENVMLYIKSKEDESGGLGEGAVVTAGSGSGAEVIGKGDDEAHSGKMALVNINTAGIDELDTLPGIGEATARDIIAYRDKYGGFDTIEDIMKVPRIKQNRFESIRDYITVE